MQTRFKNSEIFYLNWIGGARKASTKGIFPERMIIDGQEIFDQGKIANCFDKFSVDTGSKLHQTFMGDASLTEDEVKETLRSLKSNKNPGYDHISSNVVNETSDIFFTPLRYIFNLSLEQEIFP